MSQTWKCIEDVTNPWLKAAFYKMYVSEEIPSPDRGHCDDRVLKKATFKVTIEVEDEWVYPRPTSDSE